MMTLLPTCSTAALVTPKELTETRRWVAAKFEGVLEPQPQESGLVVLADNDQVIPNSRGGTPLNLTGKEYTRGLYCHAGSKVIARLPGPGKTFSAVVGVDSNEQTSGGRGGIAFSVSVGEKRLFQSEVLRESVPAVPVEIDLEGATKLVLEVGDTGDDISCDQSDWADTCVALADGATVSLGDLPFLNQGRSPFTTDPPFSFTYDGKPSSEVLATWELKRNKRELDKQRTKHVLTCTAPESGLQVRCVVVEYSEFPTVEWTLYLRSIGPDDTGKEILPPLSVVILGGLFTSTLMDQIVTPTFFLNFGESQTRGPATQAETHLASGVGL